MPLSAASNFHRELSLRIYWIKAQAPRRVLALAKHLGVNAEYVEMDLITGGLTTPGYVALNPYKKGANSSMASVYCGNRRQSWPIFASSKAPTCGRHAIRTNRSKCSAGFPGMTATGTGRRAFRFRTSVKSTFGIGSPDVRIPESKVANLRKFAEVLEGHLNGRERVACGRLTIADFQLASMATDWREAAMPFCDFPNILRWLDGLAHIPAWANPWPVARVSN